MYLTIPCFSHSLSHPPPFSLFGGAFLKTGLQEAHILQKAALEAQKEWCVIVNFMCQLGWVTGYQDIGQTFFLLFI